MRTHNAITFLVLAAATSIAACSSKEKVPDSYRADQCASLCKSSGFLASSIDSESRDPTCSCSGGTGTVMASACKSMCSMLGANQSNPVTSSPSAPTFDTCQCTQAGSSGDAGGPGSSGSTGVFCNDLERQGDGYDIFSTKALAPAPLGGTITDGKWVATSGKVWGSTKPEGTVTKSGSTTFDIRGTALQRVSTVRGGANQTRQSGTLTTNGTTFEFTETCPGAGAIERRPYTATDTTLSLYAVDGQATQELVFTKQ